MKSYDLIVIGSGAGLMVTQAALQQGLRCALIEKGRLGGTCLNRGCIPSKVLVHPADLIREAQESGRVGLSLQVENVDWQSISRRLWDKVGESETMEKSLRENDNLDYYKGHAAFVDSKTLEVKLEHETVCMKGGKILIAAGARSFVPPVEGLEQAGYLTSETFFGPQYPEKIYPRLIIIGGGAIGCEFAHVFSAYGTDVTIVEMMPRLAPSEEPEVSQLLEAKMKAGGSNVLTGHKALKAFKDEKGKHLVVSDEQGKTQTLVADEILVASGVRSNGDGLDLEKAGVKTDSKGYIVTDESLKTSAPDVYALGDINGKYQFRHKANYEADIFIHNMFSEGEKREAHYGLVPWAIFTHPQIAHVGMTQEQALATGRRIMVGKNYYSMTANGYAHGFEPGDEDDGFVKLIADEEGRILGVSIIGPHASILIQSFVYLMNAGFSCNRDETLPPYPQQTGARFCLDADSIDTIDQSMVIHPSLSEVAAWVTGELEWVN